MVDQGKMEYNLASLFDTERLEAFPDSCKSVPVRRRSSTMYGYRTSTECSDTESENGTFASGLFLSEEDGAVAEVLGKDDTQVLCSDLEKSITDSLVQDRDNWKAKAKAYGTTFDAHRSFRGSAYADLHLPVDVVARLNYLEREYTRLRTENADLKNTLRASKRENVVLNEESAGKSRKLKGAKKNFRQAKNAAKHEEEKAKSAVHDKNQRLASERKMRKERNDALAAYEEQKKISEELRVELEVERCGRPHLREDGTEADETTVVVPIEFKIDRADFRKLVIVFDSNQMKITDELERWYKQWKKPKEVVVPGSELVEDERKKIRIGADIYADSNKWWGRVDRELGVTETGAEHDGWVSKRGLLNICRHAQASYNSTE
ncbi:hypothetical protein CC78DRAFT_547588 [Lojkania enalia]|uniref:Uncharacterized protein n=1 Tax=Lojkania enalia TaxID=147567 RepID=A0A9P4MWN7_9PLEO|nr:hypothetical protein CC78DRAFT_547588 [Didymosphaeria enalia]